MAEFRRDPLGERVIVAPGRAERPYDFTATAPERLEKCPFCPGRESQTPPEVYAVRPNGTEPDAGGWSLRAVPNRFPAVPAEPAAPDGEGTPGTEQAFGVHEVIIESADHQIDLSEMTPTQVHQVLIAWRERLRAARRNERLRFGLVFKNRGARAGASLEHPHSQLLAVPFVPERIAREVEGFRSARLGDSIRGEMEDASNAVLRTASFVVFAPFVSRFSYQIQIHPTVQTPCYEDSGDDALEELSHTLARLLGALDRMKDRPAYHLIVHTAPFAETAYWWRIELFPRLGAVAGFEWATGVFLNQVAPEQAAREWRAAL